MVCVSHGPGVQGSKLCTNPRGRLGNNRELRPRDRHPGGIRKPRVKAAAARAAQLCTYVPFLATSTGAARKWDGEEVPVRCLKVTEMCNFWMPLGNSSTIGQKDEKRTSRVCACHELRRGSAKRRYYWLGR